MFLNNSKNIVLISLFLMCCLLPYSNANAENDKVQTGRLVKSLNDNWKFYKGSQGQNENFSKENFNDRSWEQIQLPHTWNAKDGIDGGNNYYRGDGWYRKELQIPESYKGKALFLQFAAANKEAEVFVNGKRVFVHRGGYTAFTVEITDYVNFGQPIYGICLISVLMGETREIILA